VPRAATGSLRFVLVVALTVATAPTPTEAEDYPSLGGADPMRAHRILARRAGLPPCSTSDLDCRAFTGTLAWRPDERKPLLSAKALRRLALVRRLPGGQRERALRCLAFIAWAEARSDGIKGMRAVIAVALNRSLSAAYPDHPCAVIGQPGAFEPMIKDGYRQTALALKQRRLAPFPRPRSVVDAAALQLARLLVWTMAQKPTHDDPTAGATHFVAPFVLAGRGQRMPRWTRVMERTARIGGHHFYRPRLQIAQEP
jgi:hypothetical protein